MKIKPKYIMESILSIPKTLYFNFRMLPLRKAIRLPFFISYRTQLGELQGNVSVPEAVHPFMVKIGIAGSEGVAAGAGYFSCGKGSDVIFQGKTLLCQGTSVRCDSGKLTFGENFSANRNSFFSCSHEITFGRDVLIGFHVWIRDSDGHTIFHNGIKKESKRPVRIGDHVWICSDVHILKGTVIGDNNVVAAGSYVWGEFREQNCLLGGYPAGKLQDHIDWQK